MLLPWTKASPLFSPTNTVFEPTRLSHCIFPDDGGAAQIALLGVPSDLAVQQGGGRVGAALGPAAIRSALYRYGTLYNLEYDIDLSGLRILDCGDLIPDPSSVLETHQRLTEAVSVLLARSLFPILLGGGHDLTFAAIRALTTRGPEKTGGIVFDAHCDLRPVVDGVITSGTPFWNILEHLQAVDSCGFVEIGLNGLVNAKVHLDYLKQRGGHFFSLYDCQRLGMKTVLDHSILMASEGTEQIFFSMDLDVLAQAFAPGVSAPSPEGLRPEDFCLGAYEAGRAEQVSYFDIMEMNPEVDVDGRTAKLAAAAICHFCAGFVQRREK